MDCSTLFSFRVLLLAIILSLLSACGGKGNGEKLSVSRTTLTFNTSTTTQSFTIRNTGSGTVTWSITDDQTWLSFFGNVTNQTTTTETDSIRVTVNRIGLPQGSYQGTIRITSNGGNINIAVTMVVGVAGGPGGPLPPGPQNPSAPRVSITSPLPGAIFTPTQLITFRGSATDLVGSAIPSTSLTWTTNLAPFTIGTGRTATATLSSGTHFVRLSARDSAGLTGFATVTVTVSGVGGGIPTTNNLPVIISIAPTTAVMNLPFSYDVQATDADGDILTYTLVGNPIGMTINARSGLISWRPTTLGNQTITISVSDGRGGTATQIVNLSIVNTDTTRPINTTRTTFINNNATQTGSNSVVLALTATDNVGITGYIVKDSGTTLPPPTPLATQPGWLTVASSPAYRATVAYSFSAFYPVGTLVNVFVWFKDASGNVSTAVSGSISRATLTTPLNATPRNFIDLGAIQTGAQTVSLNLAATDDVGITGYFVSDSSSTVPPVTPNANAPTWISLPSVPAYVATVTYRFSTIYANGSTANVYVWFKDASGLVSLVASDTIRIAGGGGGIPPFPPGPGPIGGIFTEGFEFGLTSWLINNGVWGLIRSDFNSQQCFSGSQCLGVISSFLDPNFFRESHVTSPIIRVPGFTTFDSGNNSNITLSFWQKTNFSGTNGGRIIISEEHTPGIFDHGDTVYEIDASDSESSEGFDISTNPGFDSNASPWFQTFIDLSSYAGATIRVSFVFVHNTNTESGDDGNDHDNDGNDDHDRDDDNDFRNFDQNLNQSLWTIDDLRVGTSFSNGDDNDNDDDDNDND